MFATELTERLLNKTVTGCLDPGKYKIAIRIFSNQKQGYTVKKAQKAKKHKSRTGGISSRFANATV
jgi:hypothetical protein